VSSNKVARRLDVHVLRPHQYGHEVIALQAPAKFHVVGIQVLELNKNESATQPLALGHYLNLLTFAQQTMSTALK
jgi:hypothetical protein